MSTFMDKMKALAKGDKKTIVLAEGEERRTVQVRTQYCGKDLQTLSCLATRRKSRSFPRIWTFPAQGLLILPPAT